MTTYTSYLPSLVSSAYAHASSRWTAASAISSSVAPSAPSTHTVPSDWLSNSYACISNTANSAWTAFTASPTAVTCTTLAIASAGAWACWDVYKGKRDALATCEDAYSRMEAFSTMTADERASCMTDADAEAIRALADKGSMTVEEQTQLSIYSVLYGEKALKPVMFGHGTSSAQAASRKENYTSAISGIGGRTVGQYAGRLFPDLLPPRARV